jgi:hypothetical protein
MTDLNHPAVDLVDLRDYNLSMKDETIGYYAFSARTSPSWSGDLRVQNEVTRFFEQLERLKDQKLLEAFVNEANRRVAEAPQPEYVQKGDE